MTIEELKKIPVDELYSIILKLESEIKEKEKAADSWQQSYFSLQEKFNRYKDAVKSVVLFIDLNI